MDFQRGSLRPIPGNERANLALGFRVCGHLTEFTATCPWESERTNLAVKPLGERDGKLTRREFDTALLGISHMWTFNGVHCDVSLGTESVNKKPLGERDGRPHTTGHFDIA